MSAWLRLHNLTIATFFALSFVGCSSKVDAQNARERRLKQVVGADVQKALGKEARIILLHHSTGRCIWEGGVPDWFEAYNETNGTNYQIREQEFPRSEPYGWKNYPYDYWNIWVRHAGTRPYREEPTLEILAPKYDVVIFKHCFPVSKIESDIGRADVGSEDMRAENYKLQYAALKKKLREFPKTRFIVWTGAVEVRAELEESQARRAQVFFEWVKRTWDEPGDNIYVWDFYTLETEGGLYLKPEYSSGDAHPNEEFSRSVAPYLCQRIVDVVVGRGDTKSVTGTSGKPIAAKPQTPSPARREPKASAKRPVFEPTQAKWVFDNAEDAERNTVWRNGVDYTDDETGSVINICFANGAEEDWGEYGRHRIVATNPQQKDWDISAYRYLALRAKSDRPLQLTLTLVTEGERTDDSYFGYTAYLQADVGKWKWFALDLTKLELGAEGEKAYAAAGKPSRPKQLTYLKLALHEKHATCAFAVDDLTFYTRLPASLVDKVVAP